MRIEQVEVGGSICLVIKELYDGVFFEAEKGNRIAMCMRDDTFEIAVIDKTGVKNAIHRVDMTKGTIHAMEDYLNNLILSKKIFKYITDLVATRGPDAHMLECDDVIATLGEMLKECL